MSVRSDFSEEMIKDTSPLLDNRAAEDVQSESLQKEEDDGVIVSDGFVSLRSGFRLDRRTGQVEVNGEIKGLIIPEEADPPRVVKVKLFSDAQAVTAASPTFVDCIPETLNGLSLISAHAWVSTVSSSGTPTVTLTNATTGAILLATPITIDAGEYTSYDALVQPVVNPVAASVSTGDIIRVNVTVAGTGTKGLGVILTYA
jgi:hypothetical protein